MESLKNHLKATRKNEILWLVFSKITLLPLAILIAYIVTQYIVLLIIFLVVVLLLYLITFRIWRKYLNKRYVGAYTFIKILESKTEHLIDTFQELIRTQLPEDLYWIDFKIDPSSFEIETKTHSTVTNSTTLLTNIATVLSNLLKVDKSTITEYKKVGWEADDNIELSLELIQRWFTEIWTNEVSDEFKIKASFSVKNRDGHFDLESKKWEETSIIFGKPLQ